MGKRIGIMQPYFFPYVGYYQLISAVDAFVVYDNLKYTKKGWINRNRYLEGGRDVTFTIPLQKGSDELHINQRFVADNFDRLKLVRRVGQAYRKAPNYDSTILLFEKAVMNRKTNLFDFIFDSLLLLVEHLDLKTELIRSSEIAIDHQLRSQDKVIAICRALDATTYINAIGGQTLYASETFRQHGMDLRFIRSEDLQYSQFGQPFQAWLSILDVLMFNSLDRVRSYIADGYDLVCGEKNSNDVVSV
ncbi:WbqC family protein [Stieleria sp. JC731]|uniref:WbqC family protein n=1 Tax=Pirellulaceae TaxID=2691357 RepID=UPI001E54E8A1|nr:WbqC family protein [Stieleria sp. JC731]MCC9602035.1 WbqC family protein [Stieleria sp. JC731]